MEGNEIYHMLSSNVTDVLESSYQNKVDATLKLSEWGENYFPQWILVLSEELCDENKGDRLSRMLAASLISILLKSKDSSQQDNLSSRWLQLDSPLRKKIKANISSTFSSPHDKISNQAAICMSSIALIELTHSLWQDFFDNLLSTIIEPKSPVPLIRTCITCVGYVIEDLPEDFIKKFINTIFTIIFYGIQYENDIIVNLCSLKLLKYSIQFSSEVFKKDSDREFIFDILSKYALSDDIRIRVLIMECFIELANHQYDILDNYIQSIFEITFKIIENDEEKVVLQAIEFWSSLCDKEKLIENKLNEASLLGINIQLKHHQFIKGVIVYLTQLLCKSIITRSGDVLIDTEEWNIKRASTTCIYLMTSLVGDDIVQYTMPFIIENINSDNLVNMDSGLLVFGSILDGTSREFMYSYVNDAFPILLHHLKKDNIVLRETCAWVIAKISEHHFFAPLNHIQSYLSSLYESLKDIPRVSSKICWALREFSMSCGEYFKDNIDENPLLPITSDVLRELMNVSLRDDAYYDNLITEAYEAMNAFIHNGTYEYYDVFIELCANIINQIKHILSMIQSLDVLHENFNLLNHLRLMCGSLQFITAKVESGIEDHVNDLMEIYIHLLQDPNLLLFDEAIMGVSRIVIGCPNSINSYIDHLMNNVFICYLNNLDDSNDNTLGLIAALIGEISRDIGPHFVTYTGQIIQSLISIIYNRSDLSLISKILVCFGDIAASITDQFINFCDPVLKLMIEASKRSVEKRISDMNDPMEIKLMIEFRISILDAYIGMIHGMSDEIEVIRKQIPDVLLLLKYYLNDKKDDTLEIKTIYLIGDIVNISKSVIKDIDWEKEFGSILNEYIHNSKEKDESLMDAVNYTIAAIKENEK